MIPSALLILVRLSGLTLLVIYGPRFAGRIFDYATVDRPDFFERLLEDFSIELTLVTLISIILLLFPVFPARLFLKGMPKVIESEAQISITQIQDLAFRVLGLFFVIMGISDFLHAFTWTGHALLEFMSVTRLIQILAGLWLMFGGKGLGVVFRYFPLKGTK